MSSSATGQGPANPAEVLPRLHGGGRAGSGCRMPRTHTAEPTNETASSRMTSGAASTWTSAPVRPGVVISATASTVAARLGPPCIAPWEPADSSRSTGTPTTDFTEWDTEP